MFDNSPQTTASTAVPATAIETLNRLVRKGPLYIEDVFDPDKHPIEDLHRYIVPVENTIVFDVPQGVIYRVSYVDYQATLKSTLVPWRLTNVDEGNTTEQDWIFGLRGGPLLGEALLSIDFSVRPNVARIDSTIMRPGAAYAKLWLNNDASENGTIISAQYDKSFNMLSNKVPTKLAEIVDRTNMQIMTTGPFSVTENAEGLPDGHRCWVVFYDEGGEFIPPAQPVMVQHSAYLRDHQIGIRYVTEIRLLGPWFTNAANPDTLMIPINVQMTAIELRAAVFWSDGTSRIYPVNGTKFNIFGVDKHRPTSPGQTNEVVLTYKFADDEQAYVAQPGSPDHKSRIYVLQADTVVGAYTPKIYTYPQWDASIGGYKLRHFLFDLDRKVRVDVTQYVTYNDKSEPFRPKGFGVVQSLIFNLNLHDVSPTYKSVIFVQYTDITLLRDASTDGKRWEVNFTFNMPAFGGKTIIATNAMTTTTFDISQDQRDLPDWLDELYWAVQPGYNTRDEDQAPTPTHFDLMDDTGRKWRYPISAYNKDNPIDIEFLEGYTYYVSWIHQDASGNELQLAITGMVAVMAE